MNSSEVTDIDIHTKNAAILAISQSGETHDVRKTV